jgi:hypothetical protein
MTTNASGMITCGGWIDWEGKKVYKELTLPLSNILFATEHDNGQGNTCLIATSDSSGLHIDVPLKQMRDILKAHKQEPDKDFNLIF